MFPPSDNLDNASSLDYFDYVSVFPTSHEFDDTFSLTYFYNDLVFSAPQNVDDASSFSELREISPGCLTWRRTSPR